MHFSSCFYKCTLQITYMLKHTHKCSMHYLNLISKDLDKILSFCSYKISILLLTYICYTCFHASRKSLSVVKPALINCTKSDDPENATCTSWINELNRPEDEAKRLLGTLDTSFLVSYAFFMFVR